MSLSFPENDTKVLCVGTEALYARCTFSFRKPKQRPKVSAETCNFVNAASPGRDTNPGHRLLERHSKHCEGLSPVAFFECADPLEALKRIVADFEDVVLGVHKVH